MSDHDDFAVEPIPGLPALPPKGETLLWQGAPDWRALAVRAFHVRKIAIYFAILAVWTIASRLNDGETLASAVPLLLVLGGLAVATISFFMGLAWAIARTTVYTITTRRVVMRFGVALPMTINLPFAAIEGAALRRGADGIGDITLSMRTGQRMAYPVLWPHARPWRLARPEPMLRCLPGAEAVAERLTRAFLAATPDAAATPRAEAGASAAGGAGSLAPVAG